MRNIVIAILLGVSWTSFTQAQEFSTIPVVHRMPDGLVEYLGFLQEQQIESLKLYTDFLQTRYQEKEIPAGVFLNAKAMYLEAQLRGTAPLADKREKFVELADLYRKRTQLDAETPNTTWFGVDRVKLGQMMRSEYEAFSQATEAPPTSP